MKIFKNKIVQTLSVITLIAIIGTVIYTSSNTKVKADDTVTTQYVKQEIEKLQTQIDTLNTNNNMLQEENEGLKLGLKNANEKITTLEKNISTTSNNITSATNRIGKIEAREDYLYTNAEKQIYLHFISKYINENLK